MGTAFLLWFVAIVFGALAIRADLFFRFMRWVDQIRGYYSNGREKPLPDIYYDGIVLHIFVRGVGAIGGIAGAVFGTWEAVRAIRG
jgi:hypothetical protein